MKIAELPQEIILLSDLKEHPKNINKHPESQIKKIRHAIKTHGYYAVTITIQKSTNTIIKGHGVREALIAEGYDKALVNVKDCDDIEALAILIADNKLQSDGVIDNIGLQNLINELSELNIPALDFGFDSKDLEDLASQILANSGGYTADEKDDEIPEVKEAITQKGDLWTLGKHKVLCGDSTKVEDVAILMGGEKAELLFTSPPYSDMREYGGNIDLSISHLIEFISCFSSYANYQVINLGIKRTNNEIDQYWNEYISKAKEYGYKLLSWNSWIKPNASSIGQQTAMFPINSEFLFVFGGNRKDLHRTKKTKTGGQLKRNYIRNKDGSHNSDGFHIRNTETFIPQAIQITQEGKPVGDHPATFPVELPYTYIEAMTNETDIVIDCFGGSGTTCIAAEKLNRQSFLMELSPSYCDVIVKRYIDFVGSDKDVFVDRQGRKIGYGDLINEGNITA